MAGSGVELAVRAAGAVAGAAPAAAEAAGGGGGAGGVPAVALPIIAGAAAAAGGGAAAGAAGPAAAQPQEGFSCVRLISRNWGKTATLYLGGISVLGVAVGVIKSLAWVYIPSAVGVISAAFVYWRISRAESTADLEEINVNLSGQVTALGQHLEEEKKSLVKERQLRARAEATLARAGEEVKEFDQENRELVAEIAALKEANKTLQALITSFRDSLSPIAANIQADFPKLHQAIETFQKSLAPLAQSAKAVADIRPTVETLQKTAAELAGIVKTATGWYSEAATQERIRTQQALNQSIASAAAAAAAANANVERLQRTEGELGQRIAAKAQEKLSLDASIADLDRVKARLNEAIDRLQKKVDELPRRRAGDDSGAVIID